jgi:outer membrane lipopolysaccharide assembly protein LptE/RlpB
MVLNMRIFFIIAVIVCCASCGYRPVTGVVPGGGKSIRVPLVKNKTAYPSLSAPMTSVLRYRLAASGVEVVNTGKGVVRLQVIILQVQGEPGMLGTEGERLVPVDTLWRIKAEARVVDAGGKNLKGPAKFDVQGRSFAQGGSPLGQEALSQRERTELLDDLADAIVSKLFED